MVIVRPTFVLAALSDYFPRRNELPRYGLQIVSRGKVEWAEKAAWFRNVPVTAIYPTVGQIQIRLMFAQVAHAAKGQKGLKEVTNPRSRAYGRRLPPAAAMIANNLRDQKAPDSMRPEQYPSRLRRTVHTEAELRALAESSGIAVPTVTVRTTPG